MHHGLPSMDMLSNYIRTNMKTEDESEETAWKQVNRALENDNHLETALEKQNLPHSLLSKIIRLTWQCINEKDKVVLETAISCHVAFPLGELLSGIFRSTQIEVHIVTTNYDRVAEYACNSRGILFQTGFAPGYVQKWEGTEHVNFSHRRKKCRVVKIWKVHGSLDWFQTENEKIVGLPLFERPSADYTPLIVTPGPYKFQKTHDDPFRSIINGADKALKNAAAFLCVGYGFRDQHIHPKIYDRCREKNIPIIVLAKKLTQEARDFLKQRAGTNYMGIELASGGSKIYLPQNTDGLNVNDSELWSLSGFNKLVL